MRRVGTASIVGIVASAADGESITGVVVSSTINDSILLTVAAGRWRQLWSSIGGVMAAKAAQECGGLRQAARLAGAGAPGRLRRDFLRQSCCVFASVAYVCIREKVRMFTVLLYVCAVGPCGV